MFAQLLHSLITHLPQYSQEGGHHTSVSREQLQHALQNTGNDPQAVAVLLDLIERLLSSTATLEPAVLAQQQWQFISFPARLFVLSLLQTLLDSDVQLLPATFWRSDRYEHSHTVDQQHELLAALETRRVQQHRGEKPAPIRFVAIAAAWFKLGQHFYYIAAK
ncbi:hypothetical protein [Thioflexithrix psekupsensis]|uniref:Uncharacterized protein n=1 Tax=Thioflexithrix psekupsensis TaxID=1570016 RepID=A0A251XBV8_9GAMM|nr:hypothetical protein [Thioflexithrix psekupsensis]OUD16068.1 hypothetical protein TPSD3_01290 [Thioflexithrix psekupsensis]